MADATAASLPGHDGPPGSSAPSSFSASGAAASWPTRHAAAWPLALPNQTTTVRRGVTAAHQASRCPLLVPVFHAGERSTAGE